VKPWLKITAGAIAMAAVGTVAYRRAADKLQFSIGGYFPNADGSFTIAIKVFNPSMFAYPVPTAAAKFFYNQKYLGFGRSTSWQKIAANGESILYVILQPDLTAFSEVILSTIFTGALPTGITYSGTIYLGRYMMPFESSYSIGAVYKKKPKVVYQCKDGYYSDHKRKGACNYHQGLKDEKEILLADCKTKAPGGSSKLNVNDIPLTEINLYLEKFQNRKAAYSEESVNNIIAAVKNETFNFAEFDPVLLWQAPDGLLYMLSGHSRLQAFKTLCAAGLENFCSIPSKILKVSAAEAEEIAIRSNTLSTKEKDTERAMYYMKQIALGKSYSAIIEAAKKTEGSNAARILAYAYLNPMGKTFTALQSLEAGEPTSQTIVKAIGQWVGEARLKFPMLTNMHEDELYNWLVNGGFGKQYKNKNDFLQKVAAIVAQRTTFGVFEQDKPLNVFNTATKSFAEKQFDEQEQELKKTIKEVEDAIKRKSIEYKGRGATEAKIFELLQNDYGYLSRLRNQFINLQQKKSEVISVSKNEISLFGLKGFLR